MHLDLVTAPAVEPVSLADAKAHLRVDGTDENSLITALIVAARQFVENHCEIALVTQTLRMTLPAFADAIQLERPPVVGITQIEYVNTAGTVVTVLNADNNLWRLSAGPMRPIVTPYFNASWPDTAAVPDAVKITYTAGYGAAATDVPQAIRQAMLLLIGHWYKTREAAGPALADAPFAVTALLAPYKVPVV